MKPCTIQKRFPKAIRGLIEAPIPPLAVWMEFKPVDPDTGTEVITGAECSPREWIPQTADAGVKRWQDPTQERPVFRVLVEPEGSAKMLLFRRKKVPYRSTRIYWDVLTGREIDPSVFTSFFVPIQDATSLLDLEEQAPANTYFVAWIPQSLWDSTTFDLYKDSVQVGTAALQGPKGNWKDKDKTITEEKRDLPTWAPSDGIAVKPRDQKEQDKADADPNAPKALKELLEDDFWQEIVPLYDGLPAIGGIAPPEVLYRTDKYKDRYYFRKPDIGEPQGFLSMTSFVKKALPTSPYLLKWYQTHGKDADDMRDERAEYGTLLHIVIVETILAGGGNFDHIRRTFEIEAAASKYNADPLKWGEHGPRDVMAFLCFVVERKVEILAAEYPVFSAKYGVAGLLDFVIRLKWGRSKKSPKVNAILDIKSGRKGFYDAHEAQLHGYKTVWNEDPARKEVFPVTHVFNWRPTSWKDVPKYELKNQSESQFADTIEHRLALAKMEGWIDPPKSRQVITGEFELQNFKWENNLFEAPLFSDTDDLPF